MKKLLLLLFTCLVLTSCEDAGSTTSYPIIIKKGNALYKVKKISLTGALTGGGGDVIYVVYPVKGDSVQVLPDQTSHLVSTGETNSNITVVDLK